MCLLTMVIQDAFSVFKSVPYYEAIVVDEAQRCAYLVNSNQPILMQLPQ